MKRSTALSAVALFGLLMQVNGQAAETANTPSGDIAAGEQKAATCLACHGADGYAVIAEYPNLAGQHADYMAKQLRDYRDGNRENALMSGQAMGLSDQDILDLSAYYASLPIQPRAADPEQDIELGQQVYRAGVPEADISSCMGCHGPAGNGVPGADYPDISGQRADYIALQLRAFRSGERANDSNAVMRNLARRLTDSEIDAVANYLQGLHNGVN